jgi:hypothetical protein
VAPGHDATSLGGIERPDYVYACAIKRAPDDARSPEQWARAVFESMPALLRLPILAGWRWGLRLRLQPLADPTAVLGWTFAASEPGHAVLRVGSPLLQARVVVEVHDARVVHTTLVGYAGRLGSVMWALATPIHELFMPILMNRAARGGSGGA